MSFSCTFYSMTKRENSTKLPTGGTSANIELLQDTSLITPTLIVNGNVGGGNGNPIRFNYCYIQEFGRYYWITNWSYDKNFWYATCSCDVLATFRDAIKGASLYVLRSSSEFNTDIIDGRYPAESYNTIIQKGMVNIDTFFTPTGNDKGCYVIGVKNGLSETGLYFYAMKPDQLHALVSYMFGDAWFTATDITVALQKQLSDPMDYISSIYWFPFSAESIGISSPVIINFGYWTANGCSGYPIGKAKRVLSVYDQISIDQHPQASRGAYLNNSPFTKLLLNVYGFGMIPVDPSMVYRFHNLTIRVNLDLYTGLGELILSGDTGVFYKQQSMMGVPSQLSQVTQDVLKPVLSAIETGLMASKGDYVGAMASFVSGVESAFPQVQTAGNIGSAVSYEQTAGPNLIEQYVTLVDEDNASLGRPLGKIRTLGNLSGFCQVAEGDIEISGTYAEKMSVKEYLESGIYLE